MKAASQCALKPEEAGVLKDHFENITKPGTDPNALASQIHVARLRLGTSGQSKLHQADSMPRGFVGCVRLEKALILSGAKRKHGQAPEGGLDRLWTDSGPTVARDAGRFEVDQRDGVGAPLFSLFDCGVLAESGPFTLLSPAPTFACRSWSVQLTVFTGGAMSPSSAWNRLSERRQRERERESILSRLYFISSVLRHNCGKSMLGN